MRLLYFHPKWATRTCRDCMTFIYSADGEISKRLGKPNLRPPGSILPCADCPKIPKGMEPSPRNAIELSERNWAVYQHYVESAAVGFRAIERRDAIVRQNAAIIAEIEKERQQAPLMQIGMMSAMRLK